MAQTMITLLNWEAQGALKHRFCLIQTFPLDADKYVFNLGMRLMDGGGNGYYTSFPPFSVIFPYLLFKPFSIQFDLFNLRILNLIAHLITTLIVYRLLQVILPLQPQPKRDVAALIGGAFFIFLAPSLYFFSNFYSWDTFWVYLWVIGIYQAGRLFQQTSEGKVSASALFSLCTINFFLIYSDYHGLLFSLSVILVALTRIRSFQYYKRIIASLLISSALPLLVTLLQYSSIDGLGKFLHALSEKGYEHSFVSAQGVYLLVLGRQYLTLYGVVLVPLSLLALTWFRLKPTPMSGAFTRDELAVLFLAIFPVIGHNLLFLQWTVKQPQAMVKPVVFTALIMAMLVNKTILQREVPPVMKCALILAVIASLIGSVYTYKTYYITQYRKADQFYLTGNAIKNLARKTEVVFAVPQTPTIRITPFIMYYSRRNIQTVMNLEGAKIWLQQHGRDEGIVFYFNTNHSIYHVERIRVRDQERVSSVVEN